MMQVENSRFARLVGMLLIFISGFVTTVGSGGGGGGTSGPEPLVYSGNTNPADITLTNAVTLMGNVLFGGSSASNLPTGITIESNETQSSEKNIYSEYLLKLIHHSLDNVIYDNSTENNIPIGLAIDDRQDCDNPPDGYFTFKGTLSDVDGTGTLSFNYVNCLIEGVTYNGSGNFTITSFYYVGDPFNPSEYGLTASISFTLITMASAEFNGGMSGSVQLVSDVNTIIQRETDSLRLLDTVSKDNNSGKMYKFKDFVISSVVDYITLEPLTGSGSVKLGENFSRVYDSVLGYVDGDSSSLPLEYSDITLFYPDIAGGTVLLNATNVDGIHKRIRLTVLSDRHVLFELDLDNIPADYEVTRYVRWDELAVGSATDLTDTDGDGMHDSWEILYGLDPDFNDAFIDSDLDGLDNIDEYQQGYRPNDNGSPPAP